MSGAISAIPLASAYPPADLPAVQLAMMIVVPVGLLFVWLALIYLAARPGRKHPRPPLRPQPPLPRAGQAVAEPDAATADPAAIERQLARSARP